MLDFRTERKQLLVGLAVLVCYSVLPCFAQPGQQPPANQPQEQPVVIKRAPLQLVDPKKYQVPMQLRPVKLVHLTVPKFSKIDSVSLRPGQKVIAQTEAIRLDRTEQQLEMDRAKAVVSLAQVQIRQAKSPEEKEAAEARLKIAQAEEKLAKYHLDQMSISVPWECVVFRVTTDPGQYVSPGEPLMTIADTTSFTVEIPVDRTGATVGGTVPLRIEDATVNGKIAAIFPVSEKFEPLRELFPAVASARIEIDNASGQFKAGQTVYATMIPRFPVTEVPNVVLRNLDGDHPPDHREVQVIRQHVVRNVEVRMLGQVGNDRTFIAGSFQPGDEVIVSTTQELPDGTQVRPTTPPPRSTSSGNPNLPTVPRTKTGF